MFDGGVLIVDKKSNPGRFSQFVAIRGPGLGKVYPPDADRRVPVDVFLIVVQLLVGISGLPVCNCTITPGTCFSCRVRRSSLAISAWGLGDVPSGQVAGGKSSHCIAELRQASILSVESLPSASQTFGFGVVETLDLPQGIITSQ